jgi:hypothetical protein
VTLHGGLVLQQRLSDSWQTIYKKTKSWFLIGYVALNDAVSVPALKYGFVVNKRKFFLVCSKKLNSRNRDPFPSNGAPVEWNWQGKTQELGEKPVPVPLCPPQIPHGLTRDRIRASAVGGRRVTAWVMARPKEQRYNYNHSYPWTQIQLHVPAALITKQQHKYALNKRMNGPQKGSGIFET